MKVYYIALTLSLLSHHVANAFVSQSPMVTVRPSALAASIELIPEPEGGEEVTAVKTMPGSRMKNMGEADSVQDEDGTVYKFWLTATAEGALIKQMNTQILKDAAKKADFPGFRKGQVPPYAMPQIKGFAVQEGIIETVKSAVEAYGLKSLPGSKGEVEVLENVPDMAKAYKVGDDLQFTATFKAVFNPENAPAKAISADDTVIDAEVEEVEDA
ncbi:unnamed protein product [Cylindrotheca closterium]|uniref:Trigger factor ribosome-binding bacterial domain-containing protein n=1 Tax=Cylindrotheca closterium TaxID=2856 RepID=A0AAD2FJH5_9STRA|nr:unnamed protein product [Cylindrotheca closterium]